MAKINKLTAVILMALSTLMLFIGCSQERQDNNDDEECQTSMEITIKELNDMYSINLDGDSIVSKRVGIYSNDSNYIKVMKFDEATIRYLVDTIMDIKDRNIVQVNSFNSITDDDYSNILLFISKNNEVLYQCQGFTLKKTIPAIRQLFSALDSLGINTDTMLKLPKYSEQVIEYDE